MSFLAQEELKFNVYITADINVNFCSTIGTSL